MDIGKAALERGDDLGRFLHRERRLGDVGELGPTREGQRLDVGDRLDQCDRLRRFAHRPDHLLVAGVADQDDPVALGGKAARLGVHLRNERAGGVDRQQSELRAARVHLRCDAVSR